MSSLSEDGVRSQAWSSVLEVLAEQRFATLEDFRTAARWEHDTDEVGELEDVVEFMTNHGWVQPTSDGKYMAGEQMNRLLNAQTGA